MLVSADNLQKGLLKESLGKVTDKMNVYTLKLELKSIKLSCQIIRVKMTDAHLISYSTRPLL